MPHAFPPPPSAGVTQTSVSPHVVKTHANPKARTKARNPEEESNRSERKRYREKQRRSEVNTQFADLTTLLKKIEAEDVHSGKNRTFFITKLNASSNSMNRVDLIGETTSVLNRIHNESRKRKCAIDELNEELKTTKRRVEDTISKLQQQQSNP